MRRLAALIVLIAALLAPGVAQGAVSYNDLEADLMCVSCNVPLNIAESPQAAAEKRQLRAFVDQGLSRKQVLDRMVGIYGDNVLAKPKGDGFNLFAWIVPIAATAGLLALGLILLPRWRRKRASAEQLSGDDAAAPALAPSDEKRLAEDMARLGI